MTLASIRARAAAIVAGFRAAIPALRAWALDRARESSTWTGIAAAVSGFGYTAVGDRLSGAASLIPMVVVAFGVGIAAASTSAKSGGAA